MRNEDNFNLLNRSKPSQPAFVNMSKDSLIGKIRVKLSEANKAKIKDIAAVHFDSKRSLILKKSDNKSNSQLLKNLDFSEICPPKEASGQIQRDPPMTVRRINTESLSLERNANSPIRSSLRKNRKFDFNHYKLEISALKAQGLNNDLTPIGNTAKPSQKKIRPSDNDMRHRRWHSMNRDIVDYYEVMHSGRYEIIGIHKKSDIKLKLPYEGRFRRNLFVANKKPESRRFAEYDQEREDDLIAMHADEKFMESLNMDVKSCLEIALSVSSNLKLAAEMLKWNKMHFQAVIIDLLSQVGNKPSISTFLDFMLTREQLKDSSRLSVSCILSNILACGSDRVETIETILQGIITDGKRPDADEVDKLLHTIEAVKDISRGVFMEIKRFDMVLAAYVVRRREKNLNDEAQNIAKYMKMAKERERSKMFVIDKDFDKKRRQFVHTDISLVINTKSKTDILQAIEDAKKFGDVKCEIPDGYIRVHRSGKNALEQVSSVILQNNLDNRMRIVIPKESIISMRHPMHWQ